MADAPVVLGAKEERVKRWVPQPEVGWTALRLLGVMFVAAGGIDLALLWYPARFGVPEFEFATISSFVAGFPVLTMGVVALATAAIGTGSRGWLFTVGLFAILMVAILAVLAVIYATTVPLALRVADFTVRTGIKKSIVKTGVQFATYGLGYLALGWTALKATRK